MEVARGLLNPEADGEDAAGEGASLAPGMGPKRLRRLSSSDGVLISTSLRRDDRNDGADSVDLGWAVGCLALGGGAGLGTVAWFDGPAAALDDEAWPFWVGNLRVRGRLSLRSGSC